MMPTEITDSAISNHSTHPAPRFTMASSFWTIIGSRSFHSLEILRDPGLSVAVVADDPVDRERAGRAREIRVRAACHASARAVRGCRIGGQGPAGHVPGYVRLFRDVGRIPRAVDLRAL